MEDIIMSAVEKLLNIASQEEGYLEKKSNKNLDDKTTNAGRNNYTKYTRDIYPALQAQPWCDMFVDWCFVKAFGEVKARQLLGGFSAYTPTSAQYYKDRGQYHKKDPRPGDQIFFRNNQRINHTGIVTAIDGRKVYTIEGNTSSETEVIVNGGAVCRKSYALDNSRIDGYGRPDWSLVEELHYEIGWHHDQTGWWYANTDHSYLQSCWQDINHHRYYFNTDGYAVTGWQEIAGKWYYFEPREGHPYECALYVTDADGVQDIGTY